jgi:hypothetical protein
MNTIPKLFVDPSWSAILALSTGEKFEIAMFALVSILWIGGLIWGGYRMISKRGRRGE